MDGHRFDELTRSLATRTSRRGLLRGMAATLFGGGVMAGRADDAAARTTCANQVCADDPGVCTDGCVCCVYANGNSRCLTPQRCRQSRGTVEVVCPEGQILCDQTCIPAGGCCGDAACAFLTDQCQAGVCRAGVCQTAPAHEGESCDDGNACTRIDTCQGGVCVGGDPVVCTAADACHDAGVCDTSTGQCTNPPKPNGSSCNDQNVCTETDTCQNGVCTGANPVVCAPPDDCHEAGICNPRTGNCDYQAKADGAVCTGADRCFATHSCQAGVCTGADPVVCTASDACHLPGACNPATGVCTNPSKTDGYCLIEGTCYAEGDVNPDEFCQICNPSDNPHGWAPRADSTPCDDGDLCTVEDVCRGGECSGVQKACLPVDQCHDVGVCDSVTGECSSPPKADGTDCADGNACTVGETCQAGECVGTTIDCDDNLSCTDDICDPATGCHHLLRVGFCLIEGVCYEANARNPENPCEWCAPTQARETWTNAPLGVECFNGDRCDGFESCDGEGACQPGTPIRCRDPLPCEQEGVCNPETGVCDFAPKPNGSGCDEGIACLTDTVCFNGECLGGQTLCDPAPVCQVLDGCNKQTGECIYREADSGMSCGPATDCAIQVCQSGECVLVPRFEGAPCDGGFCCDGACVDTQSDPAHCGDCPTNCPDTPNGQAVCTDGVCGITCDPGYSQIGETWGPCCLDPLACGTTCCEPPATCGGGGLPDQCGVSHQGSCSEGTNYCNSGAGGCNGTARCACLPTPSGGTACIDGAAEGYCSNCDTNADCGDGWVCVKWEGSVCGDGGGACLETGFRACEPECPTEACDPPCNTAHGEICVGQECWCGSIGPCPSDHQCDGGQCVPRQPLGANCTEDRECLSGICAQGVCCDQTCQAPCSLCSTATDGICTLADNADCGPRQVCCGGECCAEDVRCVEGSCQTGCLELGGLCGDYDDACCQDEPTLCYWPDTSPGGCVGSADFRNRCCRPTGGTCSGDCDCCYLTICQDGTCCNDVRYGCTANEDCCTGHCLFTGGGLTCCAAEGQACDDAEDCCPGHFCGADGTCRLILHLHEPCDPVLDQCVQDEPTVCQDVTGCGGVGEPQCCHPTGGTCAHACDCCGDDACVDGQCCRASGVCTAHDQCCSGSCQNGECVSCEPPGRECGYDDHVCCGSHQCLEPDNVCSSSCIPPGVACANPISGIDSCCGSDYECIDDTCQSCRDDGETCTGEDTCCTGLTCCDGFCRDLTSDMGNCGACREWCDPTIGGGDFEVCQDGICCRPLNVGCVGENDCCDGLQCFNGKCGIPLGGSCEHSDECVGAGECRDGICCVFELCGDGTCCITGPCCNNVCCDQDEYCCDGSVICPSTHACCWGPLTGAVCCESGCGAIGMGAGVCA